MHKFLILIMLKKNSSTLYFLWTVFMIAALLSCNDNKRDGEFTKFPDNILLDSRIIELEENYVHGHFHVYDTLLFLTNTPGNPYQVHVYDNDYRFIKSAGLIGAGPGEITNPFFAAIDDGRGILWFLDMGKQVLHKFVIDSLLNIENYFPRTNVPISDDKYIITQYYPLADNMFSYSDFNVTPPMISFFDISGSLVDSIIIYEDIAKGFGFNSSDIFLNTFLYQHHPENEKIVLAHRFSDVIVIIDHKGKVLATQQGPDMINQTPDPTNDSQVSTHVALQADEEFIYALYRGNVVFDENNQLVYPEIIHVFNWDGEPVISMQLENALNSFTLDENNQRLIGFSLETGNVVEYSLSTFFDQYKSRLKF